MIFTIRQLSAVILATAFILTGCKTTFNNKTPERIPQNPSGIYTFSFEARPATGNLVRDSLDASIVINGETFVMERDADNPRLFTFDYTMPPGVHEARYYFELTYETSTQGSSRAVTRYSTEQEGRIYVSRLVNRYPIQLVSNRGPVGSTIALVGSGFSDRDVILVGSTEADTYVHSSHSVEFSIPPVAAGQSYPVIWRSPSGDMEVGSLRVDSATFRSQPGRLSLESGSADLIIFQIDHPAPMGGLMVDVRTDIPDSVIMPEVIIPEGARSVSVRVEGGEPGRGTLHAEIPGFNSLRIPVEVR